MYRASKTNKPIDGRTKKERGINIMKTEIIGSKSWAGFGSRFAYCKTCGKRKVLDATTEQCEDCYKKEISKN